MANDKFYMMKILLTLHMCYNMYNLYIHICLVSKSAVISTRSLLTAIEKECCDYIAMTL